jgi:DNA polymerase
LIRAWAQVKTWSGMTDRPALKLEQQIAAAQDWWREAGVDLAFVDAPQGWLAQPAAEVPPEEAAPAIPTVPPPPAIGGDRAAWPHDLASFHRWWLEEPSLDTGGSSPRVAPRGPANAPLAILVPMPEADDGDTLLSGPQGSLLASLAQAMGMALDAVYLAAALPRHTPVPDWPALAASGLGEVLRHHLALAAPQRLLVLGRDVLPLLGHDPAQVAPAVSQIAIQDRKLPLLASYAPGRLLENARLRAGLWQRWLEWTDGDG